MTSTELATVGGHQIDYDAVLKTLRLNPSDANTQALLLICQRYNLDPILKHIVLIDGRPYVTRDGLLHVAHNSGKLDGIVLEEQGGDASCWTAKVSVYRKDMRYPFTYTGRYPKNGQNKKYGPEMAIKCSESMALRRAFNLAIATVDEQWDHGEETVEHHAPPAVNVDAGRGEPAVPPFEPASDEHVNEIRSLYAQFDNATQGKWVEWVRDKYDAESWGELSARDADTVIATMRKRLDEPGQTAAEPAGDVPAGQATLDTNGGD